MKVIAANLAFCLIWIVSVQAAEPARFVGKVTLPSGQTVVVAEGDFEPRSIGSYSVRLYSGRQPRFPTDDFVAGLIQKRDGAVEKLVLADIDGDRSPEIIVILRSVGTGNYVSAQAFTVAKGQLVLRASVATLPANSDPVAALKKANKQ
jgi:hypothetical protein